MTAMPDSATVLSELMRPTPAAEQMFVADFPGRSLPFDDLCASEYAVLVAAQTRQGKAISTEDAQIEPETRLAEGMVYNSIESNDSIELGAPSMSSDPLYFFERNAHANLYRK